LIGDCVLDFDEFDAISDRAGIEKLSAGFGFDGVVEGHIERRILAQGLGPFPDNPPTNRGAGPDSPRGLEIVRPTE